MLPGELQRRTVARRSGRDAAVATARISRPRSDVDRSATSAPDPKNTTDARSAGAEARDRASRRAQRAAPSDRRSPCCRTVDDQDHDLARARPRPPPPAPARQGTAARTPRTISASAASRSSSSGQWRIRAPPHGLVRNPPQEHQRRKLHDVLPLALDQVNDHRHRQPGEPEQEAGGQKRATWYSSSHSLDQTARASVR